MRTCLKCEKPLTTRGLTCTDCLDKKQLAAKLRYEKHKTNPRVVYCYYRNAARERHREFSIPFPVFQRILRMPCFYCGKEPKEDERNGLDRVDNEVDYLTENVVPCCPLCNRIKSVLPAKTFVEHCRRVAYYNCG